MRFKPGKPNKRLQSLEEKPRKQRLKVKGNHREVHTLVIKADIKRLGTSTFLRNLSKAQSRYLEPRGVSSRPLATTGPTSATNAMERKDGDNE
eukprot:s936_g6.t1